MDQLRVSLDAVASRRFPRSRGPAGLLLGLALVFSAACGRPHLLTATLDSDDAVARAVLAAVERHDREALLGMALTVDEFEHLVWPTLPVSRPEVGMPMAYVWNDTATKSRGFLAETLHTYGGQRFDLVGIEFRGETTYHDGYQVSRKAHLRVRDADGRERTIRVFGSIIRQNGRSKVYSYIID